MTNTGVDMPARVNVVSSRSVSRPRRHTDSTPVPTPRTSHSTMAPSASEAVTGSFVRMSPVTCWSLRYDSPRQGAEQCWTEVPVE